MTIHIVAQAEKLLHKQFDEVADEAVEIMKEHAPSPSGAAFGKGSHSTGATERSIHKTRLSEWVWEIAPDNGLTDEKGRKYVQYAENGRGGFSAKNAPCLVFYDGHGNKHKVKSVKGMTGWHFVEKTAEEIKRKYG